MVDITELTPSAIELPAAELHEAVVLDDATAIGQEIRCVVESLDPLLATDPMQWVPYVTALGEYWPKAGDRAVVTEQPDGPSVIAFWLPSKDAEPDAAIVGEAGPEGKEGPKGTTGAKGETGATGEKGAEGAEGAEGAKGSTGSKGEIGNTGPEGPAGKDVPQNANGQVEATFAVSVLTEEIEVAHGLVGLSKPPMVFLQIEGSLTGVVSAYITNRTTSHFKCRLVSATALSLGVVVMWRAEAQK